MISLQQIYTGYGNRHVIEALSLDIPEHSITCIIGPNGCGKSTLLKCIARQLNISGGRIELAGRDMSSFSQNEFARRVAYLRQHRDTPTITAGSLVLHGRFPYLGYPRRFSTEDKKITQHAMEQVGVWAFRDKLLTELSGGECQKVYIAMALAQDTDVLLLDEPTTFLDIKYQLEIMELLLRLKKQGKTVVVVLHDIEQAVNVADMVCLMEHGRAVFFGEPSVLLESGEIGRVFGLDVSFSQAEGRVRVGFSLRG